MGALQAWPLPGPQFPHLSNGKEKSPTLSSAGWGRGGRVLSTQVTLGEGLHLGREARPALHPWRPGTLRWGWPRLARATPPLPLPQQEPPGHLGSCGHRLQTPAAPTSAPMSSSGFGDFAAAKSLKCSSPPPLPQAESHRPSRRHRSEEPRRGCGDGCGVGGLDHPDETSPRSQERGREGRGAGHRDAPQEPWTPPALV